MTTPAPSPAPFAWDSPTFGQPGHNVRRPAGGGGMTLLAIAALSLACLAITVLNLRGGRWWE